MRILKFSPGLDPENILAKALGSGFEVVEFATGASLGEQVRDADVLLLRDVPVPVSADIIDAAPKLKLLQRYGQHLTGVDVGYARRKGIYVARIPTEVSQADRVVAEHAFFLLLAVAKRYPLAARNVAARVLGAPETVGVGGKTLGLIGVGRTGAALAELARGVGMRVLAVKRTADSELRRRLELSFLGTMADLDVVLREADFISVHLPLEQATKGFLGRRQFSVMKRGSFLINVARAAIVDKMALYEALVDGKLGGAGLDVFWEEPADPDDPLLCLPNVVLTPHIAGASREVHTRLAQAAADNIRAVANGAVPKYLVLEQEEA